VFHHEALRTIWAHDIEAIRDWRKIHNTELHLFLLPTKYHGSDLNEEDEMGRECYTYGIQEKSIKGFRVVT